MIKEVKNAILATMALPAVLWGETITFPGSGGDLADNGASGWNGNIPGESDGAILDKAGIYTLSENKAFLSLNTSADGIILRFGSKRLTTTGSILGTKKNATITYDGGTFDLSGTGNFSPAQAKVTGASAIITNGCVVTNVSTFNATSYASLSRTFVSGGSRIYSSNVNVSNQGGSGNQLQIVDGAQVHVDQTVSFGGSGGTSTANGGSCILVSGAGSLFHQKGGTSSSPYYIAIGNRFEDDRFIVTDGASAISDFGGVILQKQGSELVVEKGSVAIFPRFYFSGSGNQVTVSSAAFTNATAFSMAYTANETLYNPAGHSNNLFLATGPNASVSIRGPDFFGTGHHNVIRVENGAQLPQGSSLSEFMSQTCNSKFLVSGPGTSVGKENSPIYVALRSSAGAVNSVSNVISVVDGATLVVARMYLMGVGNELSISNGTVEITGHSSLGFSVGDRTSGTTHTNNMVTLSGETPKLKILTDYMPFRLCGGSMLRFRVPKDGYAAGYVPIDLACNFEVDSSSTLVLDCEEWAARTGGTLHLIRSAAFADNVDPSGTTVTRLEATSLPPDCRLIVSSGNVYLKCPHRDGMIISFK